MRYRVSCITITLLIGIVICISSRLRYRTPARDGIDTDLRRSLPRDTTLAFPASPAWPAQGAKRRSGRDCLICECRPDSRWCLEPRLRMPEAELVRLCSATSPGFVDRRPQRTRTVRPDRLRCPERHSKPPARCLAKRYIRACDYTCSRGLHS